MSSSTAIEAPIKQEKCSLTASFKIQRDVIPQQNNLSMIDTDESSWKELCDQIDAALYIPPWKLATVNIVLFSIHLIGLAFLLVKAFFYFLIGLVLTVAVMTTEFFLLKRTEAHMRTTLSSILDTWNSRRQQSRPPSGGGIVASLKEKPKDHCLDFVPNFVVQLETAVSRVLEDA